MQKREKAPRHQGGGGRTPKRAGTQIIRSSVCLSLCLLLLLTVVHRVRDVWCSVGAIPDEVTNAAEPWRWWPRYAWHWQCDIHCLLRCVSPMPCRWSRDWPFSWSKWIMKSRLTSRVSLTPTISSAASLSVSLCLSLSLSLFFLFPRNFKMYWIFILL